MMNRKMIVVAAAVAVAVGAAAFVGGAVVGQKALGALGMKTAATVGPGGQLMRLSAGDRERLQNMTDAEREQFMQERFGDRMPPGGIRVGGGPKAAAVEGELLEVAEDSLSVKTTSGGSRTVYLDSDTLIAFAEGAEQDGLSVGDEVWISVEPEADGVISAIALIVR